MSLKTLDYQITTPGRDLNKTFRLTEMPAAQGEKWAMRALLALVAGGVDLPEGFEDSGMAGLATVGLRALSGLQWKDAEPLLDEMMACVQVLPDSKKSYLVRPLLEGDIEEVRTRIELRTQVWKLHTDFLMPGAELK